MRRAIRALAARPVFTAVAIATLAIGFGVNAAIFSITRSMLLRPLPYRDGDRLVQVFEADAATGVSNRAVTPALYARWRERVDAFEQTAAFRRVAMNVATPTFAAQVEGFRVSPSFFPMLGFEPDVGRNFTDEDARPGHDAVVLVSDGFWRSHFNADRAIVGRSIDVDGTPCIVIGVLPASFRIFRILNHEVDLFRPFLLNSEEYEQAMNLWATLRPGASLAQARAQLATVYATLPMAGRRWTGDADLYRQRMAHASRPLVVMLESAVGVVLLIGCANVANLLLAVAAVRQKELAVRLALGANRWQVTKDLSIESLLLTFAGTALAVLVSLWIVAILNAVVSYQDINRFEPFRVDAWVLAFTLGLAAVVAIAFGVLPLRAADTVNVVDALKDSTPGTTVGLSHRRLRHALVATEVALAIVLAASAIALTRSATALHGLSRGMTVEGVMTAQVALNDPAYDDPRRLVDAANAIVRRLTASPEVGVATLVNYPPLAMIRVGVPVVAEGVAPAPEDGGPSVRYFVVAPDYFRATGISIPFGRDFRPSDDLDHQNVAIVSERFAQRFWNTTDVVGRRVMTKFPASKAFWVPRTSGGWLTIVGVARDVNEDGLPDSAGFPQIYLPYAQAPTPVMTLVAKTSGAPAVTVAPTIRAAVRAVDSHLPVSYETTFDDMVRETFARPREMAWIVGTFAALALLLSAIGVYGVMSCVTTARTREIGIRIALGASRSDIVTLVVGHALKLTIVGVAVGVGVTPLALQVVRGLLFGIAPFDPWTPLTVAIGLVAVSTIAAAIPAFRACRAPGPVTLRE
jgi:putative ABC transport system permease protein